PSVLRTKIHCDCTDHKSLSEKDKREAISEFSDAECKKRTPQHNKESFVLDQCSRLVRRLRYRDTTTIKLLKELLQCELKVQICRQISRIRCVQAEHKIKDGAYLISSGMNKTGVAAYLDGALIVAGSSGELRTQTDMVRERIHDNGLCLRPKIYQFFIVAGQYPELLAVHPVDTAIPYSLPNFGDFFFFGEIVVEPRPFHRRILKQLYSKNPGINRVNGISHGYAYWQHKDRDIVARRCAH
ncbi:hypothetical protein CLF_112869, partial [Clonorchis sinensis]